ncbi:MAG: ribosylnicotinamide kinase [Claussenomyces sp. TS43310]|nr:MAG: ribosylnicotinamide kinase [Claussenomyces sp. TS43310]
MANTTGADIDDISLASEDSVDLIMTTAPSTPEPFKIRSALPVPNLTSSPSLPNSPYTPTPAARHLAKVTSGPVACGPHVPKLSSPVLPEQAGGHIQMAEAGCTPSGDGSPREMPHSAPSICFDADASSQMQAVALHAKSIRLLDDVFFPPQEREQPPRAPIPSSIGIPDLPQFSNDAFLDPSQAPDETDRGQAQALTNGWSATQVKLQSHATSQVLSSQPLVLLPGLSAQPCGELFSQQHVNLTASSAPPQLLARRIIISISGPPCTGKTTLAMLLQEILQTQTATSVTHQDSFMLSQESCPVGTWPSPSVREKKHYRNVLRQERADRRAQYIWTHNLAVAPKDIHNEEAPSPWRYLLPQVGVRVQRLMMKRLAEGEEGFQTLPGHNMHCKAAYHWPDFMRHLVSLRAGCTVARRSIAKGPATGVDQAQDQALVQRGEKLLEYLREVLRSNVRELAVKNKQCGYPGKNVVTATGSLCGVEIVEGPMLYLKPVQGGLGDRGNSGEAVMRELDIKLFVTATESAVRMRGFREDMGISAGDDATASEVRDYWRTEAYFDGVVWPHYKSTHSWMFSDGDPTLRAGRPLSDACKARNIFVFMPPDGSIDSMLLWAVDMIIGQLVTEEGSARGAFVKQRRNARKAAIERGKVLQAMTR